MYKLPVSAIVVCYNEAHLLVDCLTSLSFCDEILVVDLGSDDDSVAVATACGATILHHDWVPIGEQVWPDIVPLTRHDWLLRADPDEVFSPLLAERLGEVLTDIPQTTAAIALPHRHYFLGRAMTKTSWAVKSTHVVKVYRKNSITLPGHVHAGILTPKDSDTHFIDVEPEAMIQHFTVPSLKNHRHRLRRYIPLEGQARYERGERFSLTGLMLMPLRILWRELYLYKAWQDGWAGIVVGFLGALYELLCGLSLWRWQRSQTE